MTPDNRHATGWPLTRTSQIDDRDRTAVYYDHLSLWNRVARWVGYGGGHETLTVHRALIDPKAGGRPTTTRLHDLLAENIPSQTVSNALDAGCGLGGTMLDLSARLGGRWTGVTLSGAQAAQAQAVIAHAGLADRLRVLVQSYDAPPPGPYDLIVAVESLAHSPDPRRSVEALARHLAAGGAIAIADDMPRDPTDAGAAVDLARFREGWQCPVLFTAEQYRDTLATCGLELLSDRDLTPLVAPRTEAQIAMLDRLNRVAAKLIPRPSWRGVMDSHHGGLALERLYRRRQMSYRLLVARRPVDSPGGSEP